MLFVVCLATQIPTHLTSGVAAMELLPLLQHRIKEKQASNT